jgi:hypothetical protein
MSSFLPIFYHLLSHVFLYFFSSFQVFCSLFKLRTEIWEISSILQIKYPNLAIFRPKNSLKFILLALSEQPRASFQRIMAKSGQKMKK